jgi:hypothetical protein
LSVDVANLTWPGPHSSSSQSLRTSGEIVFRVTGWFDGKGIRKNFPTRAEASAERQALGIQRVQAEPAFSPARRGSGHALWSIGMNRGLSHPVAKVT